MLLNSNHCPLPRELDPFHTTPLPVYDCTERFDFQDQSFHQKQAAGYLHRTEVSIEVEPVYLPDFRPAGDGDRVGIFRLFLQQSIRD